ncbi:hypothetical protein LAZ67_2003000 [Cordylochernes scorpioides]|uniref:Mos1 transposase HTH domain-containing protein n=1 Tax=Cordylochernes scorpioides TaxID=51811 RepID=A0ABY6K2E9_9ARAC|nr:hypothetical protein LAZ67_2003000 [Cordylochernes scorpioides]
MKASTKYLNRKCHFIRQIVEDEEIEVLHIPSEEMKADHLTKTVEAVKLKNCISDILPSCGHHVHPRLHNGLQNIDVGVSVHPKALLKEMGRHDITFTADNAKDHYGGRKFRMRVVHLTEKREVVLEWMIDLIQKEVVEEGSSLSFSVILHILSQQLTFPKGIRLETKVLMDSSDNCHRANVHFLGYGPHALPRVSINLLLDIFDKFFASYPVRSTRVLFPCSYPLFVTVGLIKLLLDTINSGFGQLKKIHYLFGAPSGAQSNDDGSSIFKFSRAVIKFNAKLGRSASETYILMKQVYGTLCLSKSNVFIWHKRFSDGRNTLEDDKHTGRPSSSKTPESIEKVREFVENNDGRGFTHQQRNDSNHSA